MQPNFDALYRAIVTSNADATGMNKIRVQCPQIAGLAEIRSAEPANIQMPVPAVGSTVWVGFSGGDITKPFYFSNLSYMTLSSNGTTVQATSLTSNTLTDGVNLFLVSGVDGATSSSSTSPHVTFRDTNGTTPVDIHLSGTVIKVSPTGINETWQTPTALTNWSIITLKYRLDAEDNVIWAGRIDYTGSAIATANAQSVISAVPAKFRPNVQRRVPVAHFTSTSVLKNVAANVIINTDGTMSVQWGDGQTGTTHDANGLATGDRFEFYAAIPLGNIN